jgi:hypothetical protein
VPFENYQREFDAIVRQDQYSPIELAIEDESSPAADALPSRNYLRNALEGTDSDGVTQGSFEYYPGAVVDVQQEWETAGGPLGERFVYFCEKSLI